MEVHNIAIRKNSDFVTIAMYEALGTFLLTVGLNFGQQKPDVMGVGMFLAIILTYRITGAHLGAGVTIMMYALDCKHVHKHITLLISYLLGQLLGAYLGMALSYALLGQGYWVLSPA